MIGDDDIVKSVAIVLLLAHIVVAGWLRGRIRWVVALNLVVSGSVMAYWAPHITELPGYIEAVWFFVAFEFAVLVTSLLALAGMRIPRALIWTAFVVHALLTASSVLFMFTFRMTRLI